MSTKNRDQWLWKVGAELQRLSEEMGAQSKGFTRGFSWEPRVDVLESEVELLVRAEIAGVLPSDMKVMVAAEPPRLLIRGRRRDPGTSLGRNRAHQLEIFFGTFEREVILPQIDLDYQSIAAHFENGILYLTIPKSSSGQTIVLVERTIRIVRQ
jgi:HSP20 family molecular chaperone IbpA